MPSSIRHRQKCSQCGASLKRAHRTDDESRSPAGDGLRRFRCGACGWQGLLPRSSPARVRRARRQSQQGLRHWRLWLVGLGLLALLGLAVAALARHVLAPDPGPPQLPRGQTHDGRPLPAAHPLQVNFIEELRRRPSSATDSADAGAELLTLRRHCAWGRPGGNPYRGTVEQALQAAALPPEVVQAIAAQVRAGKSTEQLVIRTEGIEALSSGRRFRSDKMAMTYGMTLCVGTRVNFEPGHSEPAALYEARDASGRNHAVMVPEVCGNVTVLGQDAPQRRRAMALTGGASADDFTDIPTQLDWDPKKAGNPSSSEVHSVPEPGTLVVVGTGLALMAWLRRRAGVNRTAPQRPDPKRKSPRA